MSPLFPERDLRLRSHWLPSAGCATAGATLLAILAAVEAAILPSGNLFTSEPDIAVATLGVVGCCFWPPMFVATLIYRPFRDVLQAPVLSGTLVAGAITLALAAGQYAMGLREFAPSGTFSVFLLVWFPVTLTAVAVQLLRSLVRRPPARPRDAA